MSQTFVRDPDLCVITCAVTGVLANRKQGPGIPYTPEEIGEECKRAYDAGAAVVHIHARQEDGTPTFDPKVFARIKEEVTKRCPILLNFSTGTILEDVSEQCTYIGESRPHIAALNMGTMNYSKYSENRKSFVFDMVFPNTYSKIIKLLEAMNAAGVTEVVLEGVNTGDKDFSALIAKMKEAGVSNLKITIKAPQMAYASRSAELIAAMLAEVGVEEIAPGVLNGEAEQIGVVGREVIPTSREIRAADWWEVAASVATA